MIKNIKKWFTELGKVKCPKCRKTGFENNILNKVFIEKKILSKQYLKTDKISLMKGYSKHPLDGGYSSEIYEEEIDIYDIDYLCNNCQSIIKHRTNSNVFKIIMNLSEYNKLKDDKNND